MTVAMQQLPIELLLLLLLNVAIISPCVCTRRLVAQRAFAIALATTSALQDTKSSPSIKSAHMFVFDRPKGGVQTKSKQSIVSITEPSHEMETIDLTLLPRGGATNVART
uniref:Putative secreted protein n=1 Tax=Anopheles darlingi TaxID=43151 RepID=A0A2M4DGI7_ANODA